MTALLKIFRVWRHLPVIVGLLFKRGTSWKVRGLILAAFLYLIIPYDIIPEWLLGFGLIDDALVVTGLLALAQAFSENKR